jgi:rhodanese-related sulfurtransferase
MTETAYENKQFFNLQMLQSRVCIIARIQKYFIHFNSNYFQEMRLLIFLGFLVLSDSAFCQVPDSLKYISLGPAEFQQALLTSDKALLIDVREFFEYKKSRIDHAVNIPSSGDLDLTADTIAKDYSLFLYCTSGFRSKRVAKHLYDKGLTNLYSLDGGISAWKKEGLPVSKKKIRR